MQTDNQPCSRCGHTLYEHSMGDCDLNGCSCQGWVASRAGVTVVCYDMDRLALIVAVWVGGAVGLFLGWVLWG